MLPTRALFLSLFLGLFTGCQPGTDKLTDKKIFKYNQPEALSSLDPAFARNQANIWATTQLYNGLVELDDQLKPAPAIARTWKVSPDGLKYTFYLRPDVYFHDHPVFPKGRGRRVVAEDFRYSFQRLLNPQTASTGSWVFKGKVLENAQGMVSDTCFKIQNDSTLIIYLKEPFISFIELLSMPYCFVVPREITEKYGKDFREHPVGTGPFLFKLWDEGNAIVLHKNPNYWKKDQAGNQLPYLDAVQISFINDRKMEFLTFQQKKLDFLSGIRGSSKDLILNKDGTLQEEFANKFNLQKAPYLNTEYMGFQLDPKNLRDPNPAWQDKRVRQALNYALNKKELVVYYRNNLGIPGHAGMVPPSLPSFSAEEVRGYSYNPGKARELLAAAGYTRQNPLHLTLNTVAEHKEIAEFMQKKWSEVGVVAQINISQAAAHQEAVDNGRYGFFMKSWFGDYPDAENFLALFYSKNFSPAGPNKTHFKNARFDALYEKAKLEQNTEKRYRLYREMDKIVVEESPVIVLFYDEVVMLTQKNIVGMKADPMNTLRLESVRKL
ncbi:peptide ABC transporter substrate-binding protein [Adhaeribacter aerolatus]|uniref:Peptide ABC transporter substrate-binding protein n=1 Tax=Adhaeribacter aerolatus TaxID=670289 RepID=A0A512B4L0_9BACT|nr:ABC transporter substrate-binding protein [Adhaeribacter aerolatus]GEO06898.1 peptide ABC transporter substrate-binding protein [Adhaeribacter aerolatus]